MRDRLQLWFKTLVEKWKSLSRTRKIRFAAIGAGVLVALILTMVLTFRTTWVVAFTHTDAATAGEMQSVLNDAGIRSRTNLPMGEVLVPAGRVDDAQMAIQGSSVMTDVRFNFQMALDNMGMGTTANQQHEMFLRAQETRIAVALEAVPFVTRAEVQLTTPNVPTFLANTVQSTAGVLVFSSRSLTPEEGEAIARMVSRWVINLPLDNIEVVDGSNLNVIFSEGQAAVRGNGGTTIADSFEANARNIVRQQINEALGPLFNEVSAGISLRINWDIMESVAEEFTSPLGPGVMEGLVNWEEEMVRVAAATDGGPLGEPGIASQGFSAPLFPGDPNMDGVTALEAERRRDFAQNVLRTSIRSGAVPGVLMHDDSSISVTVTNHVVHYEWVARELGLLDEMSWVQFQAYTGTGGIDIHPNQEELIAHIRAATGVENVSLIAQTRFHFIDDEVTGLPIRDILLLALVLIFVALMAFMLIRRTAPGTVEEIEPELSVEDLLVSSQLEEAREAEYAEITYSGDSGVKEQIDKFAAEKPESVAQLLRNWLNEDWA